MKNLKYIYLVIFCIFLHTNLFAATGPAKEYKITIKKIELCGAGSSIADCVGPITIFEGDSGLIDIASTTAGVAAASLGDVSSAPLGASYSVIQVTMDRKVTLKGTVTDGSSSNTCTTKASNVSSQILNGKGVHKDDSGEAAGVYYMGEALGADMGTGDAMNFIAADGSVSADDDNSLPNPGNVDVMYRKVLTAPVTITIGKLPTVKIAFGATAAIGWAFGNSATSGHCEDSSNGTGLYGAEPSVIITFE